ncbi:MAG: DegV family protein [Anaerolineales bacterium]|nr:DegV family protein [Anaerolineales bacterium]
MKHKIALITDSTCDIPLDYLKKYDIQVVPLTIIWAGEQFRDGVDLEAEDFYRRLETDPVLPTTSQPTPQEMVRAYEGAKNKGAEEILILTISSAMSGTYESARAAAKMVDIPVTVQDSKSNSMSLGWQVLAAARERENGGSIQSMMNAADKARSSMVYIITLDTLEFLHKGGRIGGASHFIGNLLNLKPQIFVDHQSGEVAGGRRSRTRKKALIDLYDDFFGQLDTEKNIRIAVLHNAALNEAQEIVSKIKEEFHPREILISMVSPVLGVHTGPRAVAICGYTE